MHVARYYCKRGACVAAAQRAKRAIEQYDGAPVDPARRCEILIDCYDRLDLDELAAQTRAGLRRQLLQADAGGAGSAAEALVEDLCAEAARQRR